MEDEVKRVYRAPPSMSRNAVVATLAAGDPVAIVDALVGVALLETDFAFACALVFGAATNPNVTIRQAATLCIGHLARIHGCVPDEPTLTLIQAGLSDLSGEVRGQAENAADDVAHFQPELADRISAIRRAITRR